MKNNSLLYCEKKGAPTKKLSAFLHRHCGALLAGTPAALLAFAPGWYAHADYAAAQQETKLCDRLRWFTEERQAALAIVKNLD